MIDAPHLAGATEAGDHLVRDQQRVVLARDLLHRGQELRRRHHVARRALDGLHQDGGQGARGGIADHLAREAGALDAAGGIAQAQRAAVAVRIGSEVRARQAGAEAVLGAVPDQREGARRLAMEPTPEGQELELLGVGLGQAHGRLHRLRSPRVELDLVQARGSMAGHALQGLRPPRRGERSDRHLVDLLFEDLAVSWVRMAERVDADSRRQVEIAVAIHVLYDRALAARNGEAGEGGDRLDPWGEMSGFGGGESPATGAGHLGNDARCVGCPAHVAARTPLPSMKDRRLYTRDPNGRPNFTPPPAWAPLLRLESQACDDFFI